MYIKTISYNGLMIVYHHVYPCEKQYHVIFLLSLRFFNIIYVIILSISALNVLNYNLAYKKLKRQT